LLASFQSTESWCLLTTEQLLWCQDGCVGALAWPDVQGVEQPPAITAGIIRGEVDKRTVENLEVFDSEDRKYTLRIEPGSAYYLIWSALVALGNLTRPPDPIDLGAPPAAAR